MFDFPGRDKEKEGNGSVGGGASTEYHVACVVVSLVTSRAKVTSARADICDNGEGEETKGSHEEAVDKLVRDQLG